MKEGKSLPTLQKYKGLERNTMNNCMSNSYSLNEMHKFPERHKLPKLTHKELEKLNRPIARD